MSVALRGSKTHRRHQQLVYEVQRLMNAVQSLINELWKFLMWKLRQQLSPISYNSSATSSLNAQSGELEL